MATKMELMKMLQESRGYEEITNRRPTPRPIVLYLMQLRAHAQPQPPRSRLTITAEWSENAHTPLPVKINHIEPGGCDLPIVFG